MQLQRATTSPQAMQKLFELRNADMAIDTDQQFSKLFGGTKYMITHVVALRVSGAFNTACAGGIYSAATKGGSALVAAAQSWAGLTGANKSVNATVAAVNGTDVHTTTPYLSLSTANGAALVADLHIYGVCTD